MLDYVSTTLYQANPRPPYKDPEERLLSFLLGLVRGLVVYAFKILLALLILVHVSMSADLTLQIFIAMVLTKQASTSL